MAGTVDNIMLALLSIKEHLEEYIQAQGWKSHQFSVLLASDPGLEEKEIVLKATQRNQIGLPLLVIDTGLVRGIIDQLGDSDGRDLVSLSIYVMAADNVQLVTLGNLVRRRLDNLNLAIKDYTTARKTTLGRGDITQVDMVNTSAPNSDRVHERYSSIINANLEMNSQSLL